MKKRAEYLETNHYLKLLVKSSAFVFFAVIISKIASYGYKIIIARYFGAETYGLFTLAVILISVTSSIATLGLGEGLVRYVSFYRGRKRFGHIRKLVSSSRNLFLLASLVCMGLLIVFAPTLSEKVFHEEKFSGLLIGMAIAIPFIALSNLYLGILKGFERIRAYSTLVNIYQNTARFVFIGLLVLIGIGAIAISISYVLMFIGLFILSRHYAKKDLNKMPSSKIPEYNKIMPGVLAYAWPLIFVGVLYSVFYWIDSLFLGYFLDAKTVGLYSAAVTIISLFGIAPDLFMQLLFPLISFKFSEGKKEIIRNLTQQVVKWIYLLNIPLFLLLFLFSEQWLWLLFGGEFLIAGNILKILCFGAIFSSLVGVSTSLISISGKTKLVLKDFLAFTIINILMNLLLVPSYGMVGAAIATTITQLFFALTVIVQIKRIYGFNIIKNYIRRLIVLMIILLVMGIYFIKNIEISLNMSILFSVIIMVVYLVSIYLLKLFNEEDKNIVMSILLKTKNIKFKAKSNT
ncbi:flippase [Candidatus Pacearchaeota archaeon]|nr:flippase [Candidatus Pacearchaeota archaeon]